MRSLQFLTAAFSGLTIYGSAWAAEANLSEVIVTATRLPARSEDVPGVYSLDRAQLDQRQAVFAADSLALVPSVSLSRNGAFGGFAGIQLRGTSADKTLVLIDGVPQNDPSSPTGGYDFGALDLADIDRIEVLSGPQSSLWGSDAIGGVVALTSRELDGWRVRGEGGRYATTDGSAAIGIARSAYAVSGQVSAYRSSGISKAANGREADGLRSWTGGLSGRVALTDQLTLDGRLRYNDARIDIDGYDSNFHFGDTAEYATTRNWTGFARVQMAQAFGLRHEASYSRYDLARASLGGDYPSRYRAHREVARWTAERGSLTDRLSYLIGAEWETLRAQLSGGSSVNTTTSAAFLVIRARPIAGMTTVASLRYDDPDAYKSRITKRISVSYPVIPQLTLSLAYGQGFKTPTLSETACDFCYPAGPSVGLKPERADGLDLGLSWHSPDGRWWAGLTGYRLQVRDQISYVAGRYVNIAKTRSDGLEAEATLPLTRALSLRTSFAWTDAVDRSNGARLLRVPERKGAASLNWTRRTWAVGMTVRAEGQQADVDPATFSRSTRKGFTTADLTGQWSFSPNVTVTAQLENLADRQFQQSLGYGEPGRTLMLGLRLRN